MLGPHLHCALSSTRWQLAALLLYSPALLLSCFTPPPPHTYIAPSVVYQCKPNGEEAFFLSNPSVLPDPTKREWLAGAEIVV